MESSFENQIFTFKVDIVMCIDVTHSMRPFINKIKEAALTLPAAFLAAMDDVGKHVDSVRFKVIAFGDYKYSENPMAESEFFTADRFGDFKEYVNSLVPNGSGGSARNALEALALAFKSDWSRGGNKRRHITFLFTDAPALPLGERADCPNYTPGMPATLEELADWYHRPADQAVGLTLDQRAKRLVLCAPHAEPWDEMECFDAAFHIATEDFVSEEEFMICFLSNDIH
jgi:hypothetical protein